MWTVQDDLLPAPESESDEEACDYAADAPSLRSTSAEFLASDYAAAVRRATGTPLKRRLESPLSALRAREMGRQRQPAAAHIAAGHPLARTLGLPAAPPVPDGARIAPRRPRLLRSAVAHRRSAPRGRAQRWLPGGDPAFVERMEARVYNGLWAGGGETFVASFQNNVIRAYDPRSWRVTSQLHAKYVRWTTTSVDATRDGGGVLYSSITPLVHLAKFSDPGTHHAFDMSGASEEDRSFGLWSCKFNTDNTEVIAGSSDSSIYVYDIAKRAAVLRVEGHADDVNSVDWADPDSQILFSASDDGTCKVWDRRNLGRGNTPVGVLVGHTEGITHVSSRGDGRYLITNSKDQTIKLWDIRRMYDAGQHARMAPYPRRFNWDYRWMQYPGVGRTVVHPNDISLQTFKGHSVLQTLIRAYFSPAHTTGQRFIVSGSYDGQVYIYDTLGDPEDPVRLPAHDAAVRDVAWHPTEMRLVSSSWDGSLALFEKPERSLASARSLADPGLESPTGARRRARGRPEGPAEASPSPPPAAGRNLSRLIASSLLRTLGAG
eukprot:tig00021035_g17240.t1